MRLGLLDLLGGRAVEVALEGVVDDGFADLDQLAAQEAVTDLAAVVLGVDDGDHRGGETDEVGRTTDLLERLVLVEHPLQGHRRGDLSAVDQPAAGFEDRSEEHTSEPQSLMRSSYAVFCLKK